MAGVGPEERLYHREFTKIFEAALPEDVTEIEQDARRALCEGTFFCQYSSWNLGAAAKEFMAELISLCVNGDKNVTFSANLLEEHVSQFSFLSDFPAWKEGLATQVAHSNTRFSIAVRLHLVAEKAKDKEKAKEKAGSKKNGKSASSAVSDDDSGSPLPSSSRSTKASPAQPRRLKQTTLPLARRPSIGTRNNARSDVGDRSATGDDETSLPRIPLLTTRTPSAVAAIEAAQQAAAALRARRNSISPSKSPPRPPDAGCEVVVEEPKVVE